MSTSESKTGLTSTSTGNDTKPTPATKPSGQTLATQTQQSHRDRNRWGSGVTQISSSEPFKGYLPELKGKVFVKGPSQAARYDEAYKALLTYFSDKFDHRIHRAFEQKDKDVGLKMLTKPQAPKKIVTIEVSGASVNKKVIDKDCKEYVEYQLEMKQYVSDKAKYHNDLQKCFNIIMGQCSPAIEQDLKAQPTYKGIKDKSDSISLLKMLETICYNYQSHEYGPLGAWDAIDRLGKTYQPEHVHETRYHDLFKTLIQVCKANNINFALMCTTNIDMAMKQLHSDGKISTSGTFKDGNYFLLSKDDRQLVDDMAEEICLSTRFLSLASDRLHSASKQELKNNLVKGINNYPKTLSATLSFLQYHELRGKPTERKTRPEVAFVQRDDEKDGDKKNPKGKQPNKVSGTCRRFLEGTCPYKKEHTWKECPNNPWGANKGKQCNADGELIMCTLEDFDDALNFTNDPVESIVYSSETDNDSSSDEHMLCQVSDNGDIDQNNYNFYLEDTQRINNALSQHKKTINQNWVLLDSQSTIDVFCNPRLLSNIRTITNRPPLRIHCNAGTTYTNQVGDLDGYGTVWYHPTGIANILSLFRVAQHYHVQYDSRTTNSFVVWRKDGSSREFKPAARGLYYCDFTTTDGVLLNNYHEEPSKVNTVSQNLKQYTSRQVTEAKRARQLQNTAGLTTKALLRMIDRRGLINCPVTREHVQRANVIWGVSTANLKGKTVRSSTTPVPLQSSTILPLPPSILKNHNPVVLGMDVMKINGVPFLTVISRIIRFGNVTELKDTKTPTIVAALVVIINMYRARGFTVLSIAADNAFRPLAEHPDYMDLRVKLNITAEDEHEPHIERFNRTIKDKTRLCLSTTPFSKIPHRMTVEMVYGQVLWYNFTIPEDYISHFMCPGSIMTGRTYDYNHLCGEGSQFGTYVQTHEKTDNTMRARTVSAITLRPSGNVQGSFYYFSLQTGRRLHRRRCTPLPLPDEVLERVHAMATKQKSPTGLVFQRMDDSIHEDPDDELPSSHDNDQLDPSTTEEPTTMPTEEPTTMPTEEPTTMPTENDDETTEDDDETSIVSDTTIDLTNHNNESSNNNTTVEEATIIVPPENTGVRETPNPTDIATEQHDTIQNTGVSTNNTDNTGVADTNDTNVETEHAQTEHAQSNNNTTSEIDANNILPEQQRRRRKQSTRYPTDTYELVNDSNDDFNSTPQLKGWLNAVDTYLESIDTINDVNNCIQSMVNQLCLTQMGMKAGLKQFGQAGVESIISEMKQFHDRDVVQPLKPEEVTSAIKSKALGYLMFLKKKRCGKIKARGCADGRPQRVWKTKEEKSAPTVTTESVFIGAMMDAKEGRDVAHVDIPGAFLQTPAASDTFIRLEGAVVLALLKINPSWKQYVSYHGKNKTPVIHSKALKAIYGTVDAPQLFYTKLSTFLTTVMKFSLNPYDGCVANKMINGSQCTIMWHVDDLKISHIDPAVVTNIIKQLQAEYDQLMPLTISVGGTIGV